MTNPTRPQKPQNYNICGLLASSKEPSGQTQTFTYDPLGRLTNRTDSVGTTTYRYDANNNVTNIIESAKTNVWTYDAYDHVSTYKDADGNLIQYRYDPNGNMTNLIYPGGKIELRHANHYMKRTNEKRFGARTASQLRTILNESKLAYIQLNSETPCPPRGAFPVNTRTWLGDFSLSTPSSLSVIAATVPVMSENVVTQRNSLNKRGIDLSFVSTNRQTTAPASGNERCSGVALSGLDSSTLVPHSYPIRTKAFTPTPRLPTRHRPISHNAATPGLKLPVA